MTAALAPSLADLGLRGERTLLLERLMGAAPEPGRVVGRHHLVAYEGDVELAQDDRTGLYVPQNTVVYESGVLENLIVNTGKAAMLNQLAALTTAGFTKVGVGTDSTATAVGQTQLNPSVSGSTLIQAADSGYPTAATTASLVLTYRATFGTGVANFTWNEAGIFDGTANGTARMFNRVLIGPFAKTSSVSIAYTTTVTQG